MGVILWIVVWATLGGVVASVKRRSSGGWAIACVLFGPFALVLLAILPRIDEATAGLATGRLRRCPHCGEAIGRRVTECRYCHRPVATPKPTLEQIDDWVGDKLNKVLGDPSDRGS